MRIFPLYTEPCPLAVREKGPVKRSDINRKRKDDIKYDDAQLRDERAVYGPDYPVVLPFKEEQTDNRKEGGKLYELEPGPRLVGILYRRIIVLGKTYDRRQRRKVHHRPDKRQAGKDKSQEPEEIDVELRHAQIV